MDERKFESYMGNQRPKKKQGNKKNGKKHHVYAVIVLLLAAAIIIIGGILLFYIQEIEVSGNEYCDSQEIVNCVQNDKLSDNSLYVVAKYSMGKGTVPKCLDSLKVRMKNPWTLQITVKEKAITGCVKTGTTYSYFDQSGLAGAVIPHNSGDRALPHMERDAVEDLDLSKGFENLVDGKDILFHIHIHYSDCQKAMFLFPIIAVCQRKFKLTDKINR